MKSRSDLSMIRVITHDETAAPNQNPLPWNGASRYFWVENATDEGRAEYHWHASCNWLLTSIASGGSPIVSDTPPPTAGEGGTTPGQLGVRWLCRVCALYDPSPEPRGLGPDSCMKCGCPASLHEGPPALALFNRGCFMADPWCGWGTIEMLHCRCDGYQMRFRIKREH